MQMSERQWRVLSLLERLERGEVTVGDVAASLRRSRRQVQRMRKRVAGKGAVDVANREDDTMGAAVAMEVVEAATENTPAWQEAHEKLVALAAQRAGLDADEGRWLLEALRSGTHVRLGY